MYYQPPYPPRREPITKTSNRDENPTPPAGRRMVFVVARTPGILTALHGPTSVAYPDGRCTPGGCSFPAGGLPFPGGGWHTLALGLQCLAGCMLAVAACLVVGCMDFVASAVARCLRAVCLAVPAHLMIALAVRTSLAGLTIPGQGCLHSLAGCPPGRADLLGLAMTAPVPADRALSWLTPWPGDALFLSLADRPVPCCRPWPVLLVYGRTRRLGPCVHG